MMPAKPQAAAQNDGGTPGANLGPLAGPASMAARREFNGAAAAAKNPFEAYKNMTAESFAGPDDMRLKQLSRAATSENVGLVRKLDAAAREAGVEAQIYGRAKTPFSTFGKLQETPGQTVGGIKDLSGARMDVKATKPGFGEYYKAQEAAQDALGDAMKMKQDYIAQPNRWGYTGRLHSTVDGAKGLTHELQVGSADLSKFIDQKLTTAGGDKISLHDATGYKGQTNGVKLPKGLQDEYTQLMGRVTDANRAGKSVAEVPELAKDLATYKKAVEEALPPNLGKPPAPELSKAAKLGRGLTKGLGGLGVVGGALQTADGVNKIANGGDKIEGGADITAGTGSMVAGGALMAGRVALGTTTGGAVAVVDGAKDIYTGIRDRNLEKGLVGGVKAGAGGAMLAGVATANPILIAGGAVAYGGAVVYENRAAIANAAKKSWNWVKSWW